MNTPGKAPAITLDFHDDTVTLNLSGDLIVLNLEPLETYLESEIPNFSQKHVIWNLDAITRFDSAAAVMLLTFNKEIDTYGGSSEIVLERPEFARLLQFVGERYHDGSEKPSRPRRTWLEALGRNVIYRFGLALQMLAFFGKVSEIFFSYFHRIKGFRYKEIMFEMNESGIKALGIIALTTFLIGVVIAYQSAVQLKTYGANIFIVDMLGIAILRELAPLLTAIVVAGRSGSAYAAQIGVMKITEELDAMRTMGFDPYAFLVLPRMFALMLMMPLLIFFADIMGVLGGMLIAYIELGIGPALFLERFSNVIDIRHFWVGMFKGPFFAILIASIGIVRGLMVKNDTQSIGFNTTKSVVESIFAVIICDAIFSIIFTHLDI